MSGVGLVITVDDAQIRGALADYAELGADLRPLLDDVGAQMAATTQERFELGIGPDGVPWLPSIRAREEGGKTLVDRGHLEGSIDWVLDGDQAVEIGSPLIYASVHQEGATIHAKDAPFLRFEIGHRWASKAEVDIPARPFLGVSAEDETLILGLVQDRGDQIAAYWGS